MPDAVALAYSQAHETFQCVLSDLVAELDDLRTPLRAAQRASSDEPLHTRSSEALNPTLWKPKGPVAQRMFAAAAPYASIVEKSGYVTPMICVAGSVADHILQSMLCNNTLRRAYVNNGGDIALWLAPDESFTVGICENTETAQVGSQIEIQARHHVRGIATSGWQGRSHSLGIADAVTVLADTAASADVAATIIANAVDLPGSECIRRTPAVELSPDSDLGERLITVAVDKLALPLINRALDRGQQRAMQLLSKGLITSAYINLQAHHRVCGNPLHTLRAGAMHA